MLNRAQNHIKPGRSEAQRTGLKPARDGDQSAQLRKSQKKESKILQNEATKPNGISKSAGKIAQNEAKRSQNSQIVNLDKSFGISKPVFAVASFNQFKARLAPQDRPGDKSATGQRYASLYLAYA
jgi:hypothetical protein